MFQESQFHIVFILIFFWLKYTRCSADAQDCQNWTNLHVNHWAAQMPQLVKTYLDFCSQDSGNGFSLEVAEADASAPLGTISEIELINIFSKVLDLK